jgi:hypothetical protein
MANPQPTVFAPGVKPAIFAPPATAQGNNRTNTAGQLPTTGSRRTSSTISSYCPAGQTIQYPVAGSNFYLRASSSPIQIRPSNDVFDTYTPGTGKLVDESNLFSMIEVYNPNTFPVSYSIFVGFGEFIDRRLIIETDLILPVPKPTYSPTPAVAGPILIPDISGSPFLDANGNNWLALNRLAIYIDNLSASNIDLLNAASTDTNPFPILGTVFPGTTRTFPYSGDYSLLVGASAIEAVVTELYSATVPTIPV